MECGYGDSLNKMIRDHLVCRVNDRCIQRCLLAKPDLIFKKAMEFMQAIEAADKNVQEIQRLAVQDQQVHTLWNGYDKPQYTKGYRRCGKRNHKEKDFSLRRVSVSNARRKDTLQQCAKR